MKKLHWKESNEKEPSVLPFCNEVCHWSWISQALMAALISRKNGKIEKTLINHYTPHSHNNKSEFPYTLRDGIDQETQSLDLLLARGVYYTIIWSWFKGLKDLKTHGAWAPHTPDFQANSEPPGKTIDLKAQILHKSCCTSQETVGTNLAAHHKRLWAQILHKSCCTSQETLGTNLAQILLHITRDCGHKSCTNLIAHHKRFWAQILHKSCCTSQETLGTNLAQILHKSYCTSRETAGLLHWSVTRCPLALKMRARSASDSCRAAVISRVLCRLSRRMAWETLLLSALAAARSAMSSARRSRRAAAKRAAGGLATGGSPAGSPAGASAMADAAITACKWACSKLSIAKIGAGPRSSVIACRETRGGVCMCVCVS